MSYVTSAVIVASYVPRKVRPLLTAPITGLRNSGEPDGQAFGEIDTDHCGGYKFLQSNIYAAGFNYANTEALEAWFHALPWGENGEAVLVYDVEGEYRTVICTEGWTRKDQSLMPAVQSGQIDNKPDAWPWQEGDTVHLSGIADVDGTYRVAAAGPNPDGTHTYKLERA